MKKNKGYEIKDAAQYYDKLGDFVCSIFRLVQFLSLSGIFFYTFFFNPLYWSDGAPVEAAISNPIYIGNLVLLLGSLGLLLWNFYDFLVLKEVIKEATIPVTTRQTVNEFIDGYGHLFTLMVSVFFFSAFFLTAGFLVFDIVFRGFKLAPFTMSIGLFSLSVIILFRIDKLIKTLVKCYEKSYYLSAS